MRIETGDTMSTDGCDFGRNTRWTGVITGTVLMCIMGYVVTYAVRISAAQATQLMQTKQELQHQITANRQTISAIAELAARVDERLKAVSDNQQRSAEQTAEILDYLRTERRNEHRP